MQFLTPNSTEVEPLLNDDNLQYKDAIDIKIVDGANIVGFIISTITPVRFVGVLDFGCHGLAFDEYRMHLGLETFEFVYNNDTHTIPNLISDDGESGTRPFIANENNFILFPNTTTDIVINGGIYDPSIKIDFGPEITFNHYTLIEPQQLIANVTSSENNQSPYEIIMTRGNQYHYGNNPTIEISDVIIGNGDAGTFTTNFNGGGSGTDAWGVDWDISIEGNIDSLTGFFKTSNTTTPSSGTGPNSPYDGYYMFTERSGQNSGDGQNAYAVTSNFHDLTQIDFVYHMFGSGHGKLIIESQDIYDVWTQRWVQDGQKQTNQGDPFESVSLNTISWDCKAIRFVFKDSTSYAADVAIDNIVTTSI